MRHFTTPILTALLLILLRGPAAAGETLPGPMSFGDPAPGFPGLDFTAKPLLTAKLSAETDRVRPSIPFKVILQLDHQPGIYSYWRNPGGPGLATEIRWQLPDGFRVSAPEWPAPEKYTSGPLTSYIHKGRTAMVYTVTPPEDLGAGAEFTLRGEVRAQACTARSCTPLRLPVSLALTAANTPGTANPEVAAAIGNLPGNPRGWRFEAAEDAGDVVVTMRPEDGAAPGPLDVYFFDAGAPEPVADSQKPQSMEKEDGAWRLRIPKAGAGGRLRGVLRAEPGWLAGDRSRTAFAVDLPITPGGPASAGGGRGMAAGRSAVPLAFAFLGGLLLNIMPCVFPVIGLKIMGFAKQAHQERRAALSHGLAYTAGVLLCFWTLSVLIIAMGRGWGAQLQSAWFLFALCHLFMIMSMNLAGAFETGTPLAGAGQALSGRKGLTRSLLTGVIATLTSTPCSAPFLGTALAYALSLPPLMSLGVFTLMGLGFSLPYLLLSVFPGWLKRLPKPGPWMETLRQAMCFPLFAATAYLFWTMEAMLEEWRFLMLLFGLVLTALACWLYGKSQRARPAGLRRPRAVLAAALACLGAGLWLGAPRAESGLEWLEWSPETVARLRGEGRPVYIDFTARWCATCQLNKRVYTDSGLVDLFMEKEVALVKADWTRHDERITLTLRDEFDKAAVPVNVLYAPGQRQGSLLPEILTVGNVRAAVEGLP